MTWKPKKKTPTLAEGISLAKKKFAPYWHGSEPLIAAVPIENEVRAYPLTPKTSSRIQVLFFIDPTEFSSETAMTYLSTWRHRYSRHSFDFIVIIHYPYPSLQPQNLMKYLVKKYPENIILVLDIGQLFYRAFSISQLPTAFLFNHDQPISDQFTKQNFSHLEIEIQKNLRKLDSGIALPLLFSNKNKVKNDLGKIELGRHHRSPRSGITIGGQWLHEDDRMITSDSEAWITITTPANLLWLVAQASGENPLDTHIIAEISRTIPSEAMIGKDMELTEDGKARASIQEPRVYQLFSNLPTRLNQITLRFPLAKEQPIELFGIRLGSYT